MIAVIGAGLAGLACARTLARANANFLLLEAGDRPGGKVATDRVGGFCLDRGFQVFLTSYPALARHVHVPSLDPQFFDSGAVLWDRGRIWKMQNPLRHPGKAIGAALAAPFCAADKRRLAWLVARAVAVSDASLIKACGDRHDITALAFARKNELTPECVERLIRPFFGGVFLDNELGTSAALMRYYLKKFAMGRAFVPSEGVGLLPELMAGELPPGSLRLRSPVQSIGVRSGVAEDVLLEGGERIAVSGVVLATDSGTAARLLKQTVPNQDYTTVWTISLAAEESLTKERMIILPAGSRRLVRHFVQITNIAPKYSKEGRPLVVATVIAPNGCSDATLASEAKREIAEVFRLARGGLEVVEILRIDKAVLRQPPGFMASLPTFDVPTNVVCAGEGTSWSCIEAALASGETSANALLAKEATKQQSK